MSNKCTPAARSASIDLCTIRTVALAIEQALPYSTSTQSGWREVTPERRKMVLQAARQAIAAYERATSLQKMQTTTGRAAAPSSMADGEGRTG